MPEIPDARYTIATPAQVHALAETLPEMYRAIVYPAAGCGWRAGECFGLERDELDLDAREVHLRRQLSRHYFATVLIFGGADVKTVQLAMGHTTPTITLNTYVGSWPDAVDQTRSLVDGALGCTGPVPGSGSDGRTPAQGHGVSGSS